MFQFVLLISLAGAVGLLVPIAFFLFGVVFLFVSIRNTLAYLRGGDWKPRLPSRVRLAFIGASLVLALVIFVLHLSLLAVFFPEFCAPDNVFQECAALERILVAIPTGFALGWVGGVALYVLILPVLSLLRRLSPPSIVPAAVPQGQNIAPNVSTEVHEAKRLAHRITRYTLIPTSIVLVLVVGFFYFWIVIVGGWNPVDRLNVALSRDEVLKGVACSAGYSWRIVRTDAIVGHGFPVDSRRREFFQVLRLVSEDRGILAERRTTYAFGVKAREFPLQNFTKAFLFERPEVYRDPDRQEDKRVDVQIPATAISEDDFELAARCLYDNRLTLFPEHQALSVGWVVRTEGGGNQQLPVFSCPDGRKVTTWTSISLRSDLLSVGYNGTLYDGTSGYADPSPASPDATQCFDQDGQSLSDFQASLAEKVVFLNLPVAPTSADGIFKGDRVLFSYPASLTSAITDEGPTYTAITFTNAVSGTAVFRLYYPLREIGYEPMRTIEQGTLAVKRGEPLQYVVREPRDPAFPGPGHVHVRHMPEGSFWESSFELFFPFGTGTAFANAAEAKSFAQTIAASLEELR